MAKAACICCIWEKETGKAIDTSRSKVAWGKKVGVSEASVRRHLQHSEHAESTEKPQDDSFRETWTGSQGELSVVIRGEEITKEAILRKFGHDPEKVAIVGTLEETHWMAGGEWQHRYRFKTERLQREDNIDPIGILAALREAGESIPVGYAFEQGEESAFVLSINDIQLGQSAKGGSTATIAQFYRFIELANARISELRSSGRELDTLVIIGGGDIIEGCVIFPNQSFNLDLHRKDQIEGAIALILHAIDALAPSFSHVKVLAARGNHGENRINGNKTTLSDNDDTHVFEMAKLAVSRDMKLQHIDWTIAESEAGVWTEVKGWILATTHGDVYGKGVPGASIDKKAQNWYKNMAMGRERFGKLGQADVLITHHYHHDKMSDWGACLWRQTPSQDRGSEYFEQATGEYSEPGMLTFVMTPKSRYQDEAVLR